MEIESHDVEAAGLRLHYRECGAGEPILLLHGWPTSSFLWRRVMPAIAEAGARAIALDLPGFGASDKPDGSYSFRFHTQVLTAFLDAIGVSSLGLAVHDLGGPIGLYWAAHHRERVRKLALLNTIVYPEFSWAVKAFVLACRAPLARTLMASPFGLAQAMKLGVNVPLSRETIAAYQAPFESRPARRALLRAAYGLHPAGFADIARWVPTIDVPLRIVYGDRDRILPDVASTMRRVAREVPHAEVSVLEGSGHFLQEDRSEEVGRALATFFAGDAPGAGRARP